MIPKPAIQAFHLDDVVYHRVRREVEGQVTAIMRRHLGFTYFVTWDGDTLEEQEHQENELTKEKYADSDS